MTNASTVPPRSRLRLAAALDADPRVGRAAAELARTILWRWSDDSMRVCWPSQETIARAVGRSVGQVRRLLAELRRAGWLFVTRARPERDPDTGRWFRRATNRYGWAWRRACAVEVGRRREQARAAKDRVAPTARSPRGVSPRRGSSYPPTRPGAGSVGEGARPVVRSEAICGVCHGSGWWFPDAGNLVERCPHDEGLDNPTEVG